MDNLLSCAVPSARVGVIADSHGRAQAIAEAVTILRQEGCERIYHLGDVCDSAKPEVTESCVQVLVAKGILTVKGNNDHAIVVNHRGQRGSSIPSWVIEYLNDLPLVLQYGPGIFTHSVPFVEELGLSSMIGVLEAERTGRFFCQFPEGVLFRGHGHTPTIRWSDNGVLRSEVLEANQRMDLAGRIPCAVTCGALTRELCMVWDIPGKTLTSLTLKGSDVR